MDFDAFYAALARRLGERDDLIPFMEFERDLALSEFEGNSWLPWFCEADLTGLSTVAGAERVSLPNDFLSELETSDLWLKFDDKWFRLRKGDYDSLFQLYGENQGVPAEYAIIGQQLAFFPIPDAEYPLKMRYYAKQDPDVWLQNAHDLLMAKMGYQMASKYLHNVELATIFAGDLQAAWDRLMRKHTYREEVNRARKL